MSLPRAKVLLVDDQQDNLTSLSAILNGMDLELVTVRSGQDALRQILENDFALILMDVLMPEMDGLETAELIRQRQRSARTPLIFITASSPDDPLTFRGYSLGAVDYLFKPVVPAILRSKVGVFVDLHQKTVQVRRQSEELLAMKMAEYQRDLEEIRLRLEEKYLREEMERQKRASEELKRLTTELARSNRDLEQFAYAASHDLKEPLRTITSYLGLLDRRFQQVLDAEGREFIGFATEGAKRMAQLVDDLLLFSKAGKSEVPATAVNLNEVLEKVKNGLQLSIDETGAEVRAEPLPTVPGYPTLLVQLLQNLISNAIKYRAADRAPVIHLSAHRENDHWTVEVRDNGIGFDMKYAERIFVIFQRLHARQQYAGTGVGLAICKKIVELHGGRIWADSHVGEGSAFHFTLPLGEELVDSTSG
jgi:signal transduction histidine kinase